LLGVQGQDQLFVDDGNDRLYGGVGYDGLTGGIGDDYLDWWRTERSMRRRSRTEPVRLMLDEARRARIGR